MDRDPEGPSVTTSGATQVVLNVMSAPALVPAPLETMMRKW